MWPWPVQELIVLLRREDLAPCPVLGAGRISKCVRPPDTTPDADRTPGFDLLHGASLEEIKYGADFYRGNDNAVRRVSHWLRKAEGRQAYVLYGAAHLLGEGNLVERFTEEGFQVLVLVPFLAEWEAALRRRFGAEAANTWYEVMPGVLRPPFVSDRELLEMRLPEKPTTAVPR